VSASLAAGQTSTKAAFDTATVLRCIISAFARHSQVCAYVESTVTELGKGANRFLHTFAVGCPPNRRHPTHFLHRFAVACPFRGCCYVPGLPKGARAADMLARARAAGFEVSERQLKRWHLEGLMPRPVQNWIEGSSGSSSTYPTGSGDQLIALCLVGKRFGRSQDIGWWLWWLGFPVDGKFWLKRLRSLAALFDTKLSGKFRLATRGDRGRDLKTRRTRNVIFRRLRK
jgi:hypothetical protein